MSDVSLKAKSKFIYGASNTGKTAHDFNRWLSSSQFPCGFHELNKVFIVVNGGRDGGVVVVPLALGDFTIVVFVSEVGKEFEVGFVLGNLTRDHFWVSIARVADSKVTSGYTPGSINVEFAESSINRLLSALVGASSDSDKEFVEVDTAISIGIEMIKKHINFFFGEVASTFIETGVELLCIKFSITVFINGLENSAQSSDGLGSSLGHLLFDLSNDCSNR